MSLSHHTVFTALVSVVLGIGIIPTVGNFLSGHTRRALRLTGVVAWLILILSTTAERKEHLNAMTGVLPCIVFTNILVVFLACVPGTFDEPLERAVQLILPQWLVGLPIAGISYAYDRAKPHWEPWILTISFQGVVIAFGIFISPRSIAFYRGLPELAALVGITVGIPTSIIWQYLPPHGNPIPQYAVIALTFGSPTIYCLCLWSLRCLRYFRRQSSLHSNAQFITICAFTAGMPCALAWEYYPTEGRVYTNDSYIAGQNLSSFYGNPIPRWVQVSITFGAVLLSAIMLTIHSLFSHNIWLLWLAWLLSGLATIPWLPSLLWTDDIGPFKVLTEPSWKRKLLTAFSVLMMTIIWGLGYWMCSNVMTKWYREPLRQREENEEGQDPSLVVDRSDLDDTSRVGIHHDRSGTRT